MIDTYSVGILMVLENGQEIIARPNKNLPPKAVVALDAFIACSCAGMYDLAVPEPISGTVNNPIELIGNYLSGFDYHNKSGLPATYDPLVDWCEGYEFI
jgi:hypothetical protein